MNTESIEVTPKNNVKFFHLSALMQDGQVHRITFATVIVPETQDVLVGAAFCSPKDTFTRKMGRQIALGRAIKNGKKFGDEKFTGCTASNLVNVWNKLNKPQIWKNLTLVDAHFQGLTFIME
jgi:hypothetical protein